MLVDTRDADKKLPLCASSINLRDGETLTQSRDEWIKHIHIFQKNC